MTKKEIRDQEAMGRVFMRVLNAHRKDFGLAPTITAHVFVPKYGVVKFIIQIPSGMVAA